MKILVCGMPRSMTTWAFNVIRELLSGQTLKTVWIEPSDVAAEADFADSAKAILAKCHHFSDGLADSADFVVYSFRDVRSAAVSYFRKFASPCPANQIEGWVRAGRRWIPIADVVLKYEDSEKRPTEAISQIRRALAHKFGEQVVSIDDDEVIRNRIDAAFDRRQAAEKIEYDSESMILPLHRTYQPPADQLDAVDRALYNRVESEFSSWLLDNGYIFNRYNQEIEFRLVAKLLASEPGSVVVDVGMEHGSFTQMALGAGAQRVIGFEALPRHIAQLTRRFGAEGRVEIHPCAVSNRSGRAALHVALNNEGHELDYHHTLSDLGDTASVKRSVKAIEVETITLSDAASRDHLPSVITLLKIDTDGHDLEVLKGLGALRPKYIFAEYWDTLPETSGQSPYKLNNLADWALEHGYGRAVVFRRNGPIESIEWDAFWSMPGDWGNVLFIKNETDIRAVNALVGEFAPRVQTKSRDYVDTLIKDVEGKEAEIRRLDNSIQQLREELALRNTALQLELAQKEGVIQEQQLALTGYRSAFTILSPLLKPISFFAGHLRAMLRPKLGTLHQHPPRDVHMPSAFTSRIPKSHLPSISIVTPSLNQGNFIEKTIESVLSQDYPNLEYFIQDGRSNDGTVDVLQAYSNRLSGWESVADNGQSNAINRGFAKCNGAIMGWLNADDLLACGCLAYVGEYFARHPDVDVVYGNRIVINEQGHEIGRWVLPKHNDAVLSWADFVPQETLFWRRSIWERAGGFVDEGFRFAMDWDLLLRFRNAGAKMVRIPRFLGAFRAHEKQKTSALINEVGMQEMERLRLRELGWVPPSSKIARSLVPYLLRHVVADCSWRLVNRLRGLRKPQQMHGNP